MKVLISGGTGLIGSHLIPLLLDAGHEVINLTTRPTAENTQSKVKHVLWNPEKKILDTKLVESCDAVINLAGFSVANRWSEANKKKMVDSRMHSTQLLADAMLKAGASGKIFISASAVGYYASSQELQTEEAPKGPGFLADLTESWEAASAPLEGICRRVIMRIGVVLDVHEGAMSKLLPIAKLGLASPNGSGKQWMSWIHVSDLARAFLFALENANVRGIYNAVAPHPVINADFNRELARAVHRPYFLPAVPAWAMKLIAGEMVSMVLNSQRISSSKLVDAGFQFQYKELSPAFQNLFSKQ